MVRLDPVTNRLFATQRLHLHLDERPTDYKRGQPVHLMIARETSMGWGCVIEGKHLGLLYQNPNMKIPFVGQEMEGYIANIRPDGKIDLTLESSAAPPAFSPWPTRFSNNSMPAAGSFRMTTTPRPR